MAAIETVNLAYNDWVLCPKCNRYFVLPIQYRLDVVITFICHRCSTKLSVYVHTNMMVARKCSVCFKACEPGEWTQKNNRVHCLHCALDIMVKEKLEEDMDDTPDVV